MRKILPVIALAMGLTSATTADAGAGRWGEDLRFVTETSVPVQGGEGTMSLCHLVDFMDVLFVPVYTSIQGYALSATACTGEMYRALTPDEFTMLQGIGMVTAELPATPSATLKQLLWGHAWLIAAVIGLLMRGAGALANRNRGPRKAGAPDMLAVHSLVAMSQVAIADGRIDDAEVREISAILTRLTGQSYSPSQVMQMLSTLNPSASDLAQVGQDLSEKDRQIVLEAALNIAVSDGEIHPSEYAVVTDLAHRMRIGAQQFRVTMARISAHLNTVQPV